jgi:hypothetical protein
VSKPGSEELLSAGRWKVPVAGDTRFRQRVARFTGPPFQEPVAEVTVVSLCEATGGDGSGMTIAVSGAYVDMTNTILVSQTIGITVTSGTVATLEATLWGAGPRARTAPTRATLEPS